MFVPAVVLVVSISGVSVSDTVTEALTPVVISMTTGAAFPSVTVTFVMVFSANPAVAAAVTV